jgi:hypothetical protein
MLKLAEVSDIPEILTTFNKMHKETSYKLMQLDPDKIAVSLETIIEGEQREGVVVLAYDEGRIEGILVTTIMEYSFSSDTIAAEIMFWVNEGAKHHVVLSLWKAWEYWSDNCGATKKQMSVLTSKRPRRFSRFLKTKGYTKTEEAYVKDIG